MSRLFASRQAAQEQAFTKGAALVSLSNQREQLSAERPFRLLSQVLWSALGRLGPARSSQCHAEPGKLGGDGQSPSCAAKARALRRRLDWSVCAAIQQVENTLRQQDEFFYQFVVAREA
eukprot:scaffold6124_cov242-Pinguiococcus_pyrenoidosus.AAC.1